jgi:predicted nucleic acid-binding protein
VRRTFVDAGVLIAAATTRDPALHPAAIAVLDNTDREFLTSRFVWLEIIPKARFYRRVDAIAFYAAFFAGVVAWAEPLELIVRKAETEATAAGLALPDALHVAAAVLLGADELVTTERPGRAMFRVTSVPVRSIHSAAAVPS